MPIRFRFPPFIKKNSFTGWFIFKGLFWISLFFAVIFLALYFFLEPFAKNELQKRTSQATDGLYKLEIGRLDIGIWSGNIAATDITVKMDSAVYQERLKADTAVDDIYIELAVSSLMIRHVQWLEYITSKKVFVREIGILSPQLTLQVKQNDTVSANEPEQNILEKLPELVSGFASRLAIDTFHIQNARIAYNEVSAKDTLGQKADSVYLAFHKINIDTQNPEATGKIMYADDMHLHASDIFWTFPEQIYQAKIRKLKVHAGKSSVQLQGINFAPLVSDRVFAQREKYQTDRFKGYIDKVSFSGLDFKRLPNKEIALQIVALQDIHLDVFRDKNFPKDKSHRPKTPQQAFQEIDFYLRLDTLKLDNAFITYKELSPGAGEAGNATFEQTSLQVLNITNDPELMSVQTPAVLQGKTALMGKGLFKINMQLPLLAENLNCRYSGSLSAMDIRHFNKIVIPLLQVKIEDGQLQKADFDIRVQNAKAEGKLYAAYKDLRLSILQEETSQKKELQSFVANLLVKSNNKADEDNDPQQGRIEHTRKETDSFIKFVWISFREGIIATLSPGKDNPLPEEMTND